ERKYLVLVPLHDMRRDFHGRKFANHGAELYLLRCVFKVHIDSGPVRRTSFESSIADRHGGPRELAAAARLKDGQATLLKAAALLLSRFGAPSVAASYPGAPGVYNFETSVTASGASGSGTPNRRRMMRNGTGTSSR